MTELTASSPCAGLLPVTVGTVTLTERDPGVLTSLAPLGGRQAKLAQVLEAAHGLGYPDPNTSLDAGGARILWFGRDMALLMGPQPDAVLREQSALTDQSDAWATVHLAGSEAESVLARLVPVDLRLAQFPKGATCRTLVGHMTSSITRMAENEFLILVFRSMAATLVEELHEAMEAVAARV